MLKFSLEAGMFGVAAIFSDILCHTFAISGVLYSEGLVTGTKGLRTEQRNTRNNYLNDDLAAFALPLDKCKSKVYSLICSKLCRSQYIEDVAKEISVRAYQAKHSGAMARIIRLGLHNDSQPLQNYDRTRSRHHYNEFAEVYTPRGWQMTSASPQGNRQRCAENESEVIES